MGTVTMRGKDSGEPNERRFGVTVRILDGDETIAIWAQPGLTGGKAQDMLKAAQDTYSESRGKT